MHQAFLQVLSKTTGFGDRLILEALEIQLHLGNVNHVIELQLSAAWKSAIGLMPV